MGRRFIRLLRRPTGWRFFVPVSAALALTLAAATAPAQDTTPPPPPDVPAPASPDSPASPDQAPVTVRTVRLSDVEGQVQVFQGDEQAFPQAQPNMPAVEGMRFVTGDNGRLEIEFEDGSVARVTPNSSIRLTQLERRADGSTLTRIDALTGLSYYELNGQGGEFSVHFGSDTATPQDSAVFRIALDSVPNSLSVMHGAVHLDDGGAVSVDIHPNQTFQTDPQQGEAFTVAQSITADSWDQWNSDRDQALAALESDQTTARASSAEPDNPAWNDLDYYGDWYNLPGYGQVWAPSGVSQDWDPFGNGYWGYYQSFGYTWISGYPWGWWPYHCGAWNFADSWGWFWVPGTCGWGAGNPGWFPYATVWHMPPGYVPPGRPHGLQDRDRRHFHPQPLIAVDRGPQFAAPFRRVHVTRPGDLPTPPADRPDARPLTFQGRTVAPIQAEIHPLHKGPTGESFTRNLVRTHPELASPAFRTPASPGQSAQPGYRAPGQPGYRGPGEPGYRGPGDSGQRVYPPPSREVRPFPAPGVPRSAPPPVRSAPPPSRPAPPPVAHPAAPHL